MSFSPASLPFPPQKVFRSINRNKFVPPARIIHQQHEEANSINESPVPPRRIHHQNEEANKNNESPVLPPLVINHQLEEANSNNKSPVQPLPASSVPNDDDEVRFIKAVSTRSRSRSVTRSPRTSPTKNNVDNINKASPPTRRICNDDVPAAAPSPKTTAEKTPSPPENQAKAGSSHHPVNLSSPLPGRTKEEDSIMCIQKKPPPPPRAAAPLKIVDSQTKCSYEVGEYMGKGAFARCYAVCSSSGEVLACKMIPQSMLKKSEIREKVYQEIIIHRSLSHEFVVGFHSNFEDSFYVYMMLELCEKRSLMELQRRRTVITEPEAKYFLKQIVVAVEYIHAQKVIHRDLKLGNVFITKDIRLKIGDFGLATRVDSLGDRKASLCGTPNYIAPEVLAKTGHSYEVDIWSIGCILYTLLVGRPPFETNTLRDTYRKIKRAEYQRPKIHKTSKGAMDLIEQTLQLCPSNRPTPAQILKSEFFTSGILPTSLPQSVLTTAPKFARNYDIISLKKSRSPAATATTCNSCSGCVSRAGNDGKVNPFAIDEGDGSFVCEIKDACRVISKRHHHNGVRQQQEQPKPKVLKKARIEVIDISGGDDKIQILTERSNNLNNNNVPSLTTTSPARRSLQLSVHSASNRFLKHKRPREDESNNNGGTGGTSNNNNNRDDNVLII